MLTLGVKVLVDCVLALQFWASRGAAYHGKHGILNKVALKTDRKQGGIGGIGRMGVLESPFKDMATVKYLFQLRPTF